MGKLSIDEGIQKSWDALRIFGPDELTMSDDVRKQRAEAQSALDVIVATFKLNGYDRLLREVMAESAARWWCEQWSDDVDQFGDKRKCEKLAGKLRGALKFLDDPRMLNRINAAAKGIDREVVPVSGSVYALFGAPHFLSAHVARGALVGLLKVAELGAQLDGRTGSEARRDDLREAAVPLRLFWDRLPGSSGKFSRWGGENSEGVRFVHDCLKLIDPTVTERIVIDLLKG